LIQNVNDLHVFTWHGYILKLRQHMFRFMKLQTIPLRRQKECPIHECYFTLFMVI